MLSHSETLFSGYSPSQLYGLVADVERYPEFLPWCRAVRILKYYDNGFDAELIISFKNITQSYTSRVTLAPANAVGEAFIDAQAVEGPFAHLANRWKFTPQESGTRIDFSLDFAFRSRLLESLIGKMFSVATKKMVAAFTARADALYGLKKFLS